ncbi:MAG TPA: hypothetical protein VFD62_00715 [Pyrinomonadaceae bacterium]|nr:hypothetical protein [Pyrinomonadaceae bacterium]
MNRRMFAGMLAGAAVCSTGKFTTETLAQSKPPDVARMLEVTRVPGVAAAGIKEAKKASLNPASATYEQIATAYQQNKQPFLPIALSPNMAGSLQTTIGDYAVFLANVLKTVPGSDDFKTGVDVNRDIAWAPGWGVDRSSKTPSLFHWGDGPGFKNFCWVQPARKSALVFFTNGDSGAALYAWLFRQLMNEDPSVFYWI